MELYAFDKQINALGIIENYASLRWLTEYNGLGEFQLIAAATDENINLLKQENLLWKNDGETAGIIEMVEIKNTTIEARGKLTNKYFTERIARNQLNINNIEIGIRKAITDNAITPSDRKIYGLELGSINNFTDSQISQFTYDELFTIINSFKQFGFYLELDIINKKHIFKLYKGQDLSNTIVFSEEFDNIVETIINQDNSNYKNYAIVGGRGEGIARKIVNVDLRNGKDLKELWVDAKDIEDKKYNEDGTETIYTDEEMIQLLTQRGLEKLGEQIELNSFNSVIVANGNYIYKQDYNIGDIVTCKSSKFNIKLKVRITAMQEVYDESGYQILATLGDI